MIEAIPNQPVAFDDSRLRLCCSVDPDSCLLFDPSDTLLFQVKAERCNDDPQLVEDPGFRLPDSWRVDGWTVDAGLACYEAAVPDGATLEENSFGAVPGVYYEVVISVNFISSVSGIQIYFGGVLLGTVTTTGEHTFFVQAVTGAPLTILATGFTLGESVCLDGAFIYARSTDFVLAFVNLDDEVVQSITYAEGIADMNLFEDRLTVSLDLNNEGLLLEDGCYTIQFTDTCSSTTLVSQCINIGNHDCTVVLTACSDSELMGLKDGFRPQMRVVAELKRPIFEYKFGEEQLSNGRLNRYYAERARSMELRIGKVGEFAHYFLSSLPLWDHFYIGSVEYVITSDAYEPGYEDVYDAFGPVLLSVTPYEEDARKVRCVEISAGCAPPPNYWVQGTGPNEDYILQEETGERILIN